MYETEAADGVQPQITFKRYKSLKRCLRGYFLVICILFTIIIVLCANSYIILKTYKNVEEKYNFASRQVNLVNEDKFDLNSEKQSLISENDELREQVDRILSQNGEIQKQIETLRKQNSELSRKNKELTEDNKALQNSLKMAASVGIKPQNFTRFDGVNSRGEINRGKYIGKFLGTAYTPSKEECGNDKGITNSGKPIIPGISIAIDNKYWPFGTVFYIRGLGYAVAMDTGSAIKGKYRFDFSVFDKKFAAALGSRKWDVYLVRLGKGQVDQIKF